MLQLKQKNAGSRAEWLVNKNYTFGSGLESNYKVGAAAHEATLEVDGDSLLLINVSGSEAVQVNGSPVRKQAKLGADDEFSIGDATFELVDPKALRAEKKPVDNKTASPTGWSLKALNTALANKQFPLQVSQSIGRSNDCDICLNVVHLSRRHAQISVKGNYLQVDDLNSSNGTFVNGKKIQSAQVRSGDELAFDTLKFHVQGPHFDAERTQMRPASISSADADSDQTSMRPAMDEKTLKAMVEAQQRSAPEKKVEAKKPQAPSPLKVEASPSVNKVEASGGSNAKILVIGVLVVALVAVIAYFLMA